MFALKLTALIFMTLDHAYKILPVAGWLNGVIPDAAAFRLVYYSIIGAGRIAFPIFAFTVANGVGRTGDIKRYLLRITLFALISEPVFYIVHNGGLNIFFTLAVAAAAVALGRRYDKIWRKALLYIAAALLARYTGCDYGAVGVISVAIFAEIKVLPLAAFTVSAVLSLHYLRSVIGGSLSVYVFIFVVIGYITAAFLISAYNGERGRPVKWLFYIYYPAHLAALWGLNKIIN